ncbi:MAG: hypothetical protein ACRC2L_14795 [Serratia nevei]
MTEVLTYEALKAERDALAVENQALTDIANGGAFVMQKALMKYEFGIGMTEQAEHFIRDVKTLNTPATDAALAAIRSDYMAEGAEIVARKAQVIYQERHKSGDFESAGKYLTTIKFANNIATDIREAK